MTPTEIKAKKKAKEIYDYYYKSMYSPTKCVMCLECDDVCKAKHDIALMFSNEFCDEIIDEINSIKGMGKIHKVKYWKLVKENLQDD